MNKRRPGSIHGSRTAAHGKSHAPLFFLPEIDAHLDQIALISKILPKQYVDSEMPKEASSYGCLTDDKSR